MKFMITFTHIDGEYERLTAAERERLFADHEEFEHALAQQKRSELVHLDAPSKAKTVRYRADGSVTVSDGPYVHGVESAGGFFLIEADSMEEAVEWARRGRFMVGANEVRQIVERT